jgi:EmrB/QacA subfamily drug resistance transporter
MTTDHETVAGRPTQREGLDPRRWLTLIVLLLAAFMNLLDISIVNIAIPSIQRNLHATYADVQWALAGYTLAYALVLITGGRLGDSFGRKRLFLIGVAGFTVMSALCGAAASPGMLIACRVAQGAFGAIMIPQVLSVIQVIFPAAERIKALAAFGVTAGLGTVSGPLLGGLLTQHNLFGLDWRPIFLINVPVGVLAFVASAVLVRDSRAPRRPRLDPGGVALISAALLALLYPLVQGRQLGWPTWTFVSLAASLPLFAAFVWYERAKDRRDGSPLVQLSLFGRRSFAVGIAIAVTFFLGVTSFALILTLFLQVGFGFGPLHAGLTFLPFSGGVLVSSGAAARLAPRFGRGVTMAGAAVMAAAMAGLIATVHHYGAAVTTWEMVPALVAAGLGMGAVLAPLADIVLDRVPEQHAGSASGVFNTSLQLGASIGVAVIGVIFFGLLGSQSAPAAAAVAPQLRSELAAAHVPAPVAAHVATQFGDCLHARVVATDPTVTPAACRLPGGQAVPPAVSHIVSAAGPAAVRRDFAASVERTLWFQVGVFGASFLLMLALPRGAGRRRPEAADAAADEDAEITETVAVTIGGSHAYCTTRRQRPHRQLPADLGTGERSRGDRSRPVASGADPGSGSDGHQRPGHRRERRRGSGIRCRRRSVGARPARCEDAGPARHGRHSHRDRDGQARSPATHRRISRWRVHRRRPGYQCCREAHPAAAIREELRGHPADGVRHRRQRAGLDAGATADARQQAGHGKLPSSSGLPATGRPADQPRRRRAVHRRNAHAAQLGGRPTGDRVLTAQQATIAVGGNETWKRVCGACEERR